MKPEDHEQRRHPRAAVDRPIRYRHRGLTRDGRIGELSEGGACLQTSDPVVVGGELLLHLPLDQWRGSPDGCDVAGQVVRAEGDRVGVAFPRRLLPRHLLLLRDFVWRSRRSG